MKAAVPDGDHTSKPKANTTLISGRSREVASFCCRRYAKGALKEGRPPHGTGYPQTQTCQTCQTHRLSNYHPSKIPPVFAAMNIISKSSRIGSFKKAAESPPRNHPHLEQDDVPEYDLAIDDLRNWLQTRFPEHSFKGKVRNLPLLLSCIHILIYRASEG